MLCDKPHIRDDVHLVDNPTVLVRLLLNLGNMSSVIHEMDFTLKPNEYSEDKGEYNLQSYWTTLKLTVVLDYTETYSRIGLH